VLISLTQLGVRNLLSDSPAVEEITSNRQNDDANNEEHATNESTTVETASSTSAATA